MSSKLTPKDAEIIIRLAAHLDSETIHQLAKIARNPEAWAKFKAIVHESHERIANK